MRNSIMLALLAIFCSYKLVITGNHRVYTSRKSSGVHHNNTHTHTPLM